MDWFIGVGIVMGLASLYVLVVYSGYRCPAGGKHSGRNHTMVSKGELMKGVWECSECG